MKRNANHRMLTTAATCGLAIFAATTRTATAVPIKANYVDDSRCDVIANQKPSHELGRNGFFPVNERFAVQVTATTLTTCVPNDGVQNDWNVTIQNTSGLAWQNLFFVCDLGMFVGNADGSMEDTIGAPGIFTDAFKIDGTVTLGLNNNLLGESGVVDEIFSPGEIWRFNVTNFGSTAGTPAPIFQTPGRYAGSDPIVIPQTNTASIVAQPVPEPTTVGAIGLVCAAMLMRRPRRA